jgi:nicotinamide mononucleotide transporter
LPTWTEALGFVTGAVCVGLIVRENAWNWPIGLANNAFFFVLFLRSRLYGDMMVQVVYFVLGIYGWWHWLFGGVQRSQLPISRLSRAEWIVIVAAIPALTAAVRPILIAVNGASPLMDALTTVLSLIAQYLMTLKRIEHWWLWILADALYVPLYVSRQLPLTAVLYFGFLLLCIAGLRRWRRSIAA